MSPRVFSEQEEKVIGAAKKLLDDRGIEIPDIQPDVTRDQEYWSVWFAPIPVERTTGGEGFVIRLKADSLEFVDVKKFQ